MLSVVMPVYNEEASIGRAIDEVIESVFSVVPDAELVVVNDGSRDRTAAIVDEAAARDPRVRALTQPNAGHGAALFNGIESARGDVLFLVDSDRQIPLDVFAEAWRRFEGFDALLGVRHNRQDPLVRRIISRAVQVGLFFLLGAPVADANAPFKIVRTAAWQRFRPLIGASTLTPSLFLAAFLKRQGYRVTEMSVPHREREAGDSHLRYGRLARFCVRALGQLLAFSARLRRMPR